jgi:ribonuclease I
MDEDLLSDSWRPPLYRRHIQLTGRNKRPQPTVPDVEVLSLHGLEPGTEEYRRVEALLIERICNDIGDY